jgi:hypothetical protein
MELPTDFRIGSVLRRTRFVFARNFFNLAGIAGIALVPSGFIVPARDGCAPVNLGLPTGAAISIYVASILFGHSIMCFVAFQRMRGRPTSLSGGLTVGLHRSLPPVGITLFILVILGILQSLSGSYLAAAIAGVILLPIWLIALPVCVIEGLGPLRSFGRSRALTKGHRWKMLVLLTMVAGAGLLTTMRFLVRAILSFGPPEIVGPIARIDTLTWTALWTAFFAVLLAVSYHELRAAKEGNESVARSKHANRLVARRYCPGLLLEITQIGRRLVLLGRHQDAVGAEDIHFLAEGDQPRSFDTIALPPVGTRI